MKAFNREKRNDCHSRLLFKAQTLVQYCLTWLKNPLNTVLSCVWAADEAIFIKRKSVWITDIFIWWELFYQTALYNTMNCIEVAYSGDLNTGLVSSIRIPMVLYWVSVESNGFSTERWTIDRRSTLRTNSWIPTVYSDPQSVCGFTRNWRQSDLTSG